MGLVSTRMFFEGNERDYEVCENVFLRVCLEAGMGRVRGLNGEVWRCREEWVNGGAYKE